MDYRGLQTLGYHRFEWNGGDIIEYWKGIGKDESDFDTRLGVRFGEWKGRLLLVYIVFPSYMIPLNHIKTYGELEQLYNLLKWREPLFEERKTNVKCSNQF